MSSLAIGYGTAIGFACLISSIYFYCTMRGQRCYGDDEVENIFTLKEGEGMVKFE